MLVKLPTGTLIAIAASLLFGAFRCLMPLLNCRAAMRFRVEFTLIELLVYFAILALLVSLLSGAVQNARESTRRMQCMNQQRQHGLGIQMHISKLGFIPSNGGYDGKSTAKSPSGVQVAIGTFVVLSGEQLWLGVGQPGASPTLQTGSWAYAILPSLEQHEAYDLVQVESAGPLFNCLSRSREKPLVPVADIYGIYTAAGRAWAKTDYAGNSFVIQKRPLAMRPSAIADGMSQTLATGEKAFDPLYRQQVVGITTRRYLRAAAMGLYAMVC